MITGLAVIIIGILFIIIPHFALPLHYLAGGSGARLLSECSIWYHPELYIGILVIITGMASFKYKRVLWLTVILGILALGQSFILRPVSFYIQSQDPVVILGQTYSLRAHVFIRQVLLVFSLLTVLISLPSLIIKRKEGPPVITISHISASNLRRRRFRTIAIVLSLTIVIGIFFSYILLTRSIESTLEIGAGRLGADLMIVPEGAEKSAETVLISGGPTLFYLKKDVLAKLRGYSEIEKVSPQLYMQPFTQLICCTAEKFLIIAYDPKTDFTVAPWIRYALNGEQGMYDVVVGDSVKYYPGQDLTLYGRKLKVVASLEPTGLGYFDKSIFIPLEGARRMLRAVKKYSKTRKIPRRRIITDKSFSQLTSPEKGSISVKDVDPEGISAVFVKVRDNVSVKELAKKIEKDINGVTAINVKESTVTVKRQLTSMLKTFFLPVIVLLVMCTLILAVVFSMSVNERQREIGLLRAMGSHKATVFRLVITEALLMSCIGAILGTLFGAAVFLVFKNNIMAALNLLYIWPSPLVIFSVILMTVVTALLIGLFSGLYPAIRASRMEPYLAIRSGER
ncbi:macrolide export ATP-binding/permease protein MacB [bacterium BMS3Bbin06]|nr:macrolide export ATP-binding/permease protein MacB [bacterium BMS3Abin08]GBE35320.1 macrolide export ATP-binding/permease protein MacB [bacterium BMS3Bbin06]HDL20100.1 ABC transporter permease [Nitrospirota bacterium]HDY71198.1 ABC transporter permease [Nitrospirota bacterium]